MRSKDVFAILRMLAQWMGNRFMAWVPSMILKIGQLRGCRFGSGLQMVTA